MSHIYFNCQYCSKKEKKNNVKNHKCIRIWISCSTCKKEFTNDRYLKHKKCVPNEKQTSESKLQFWEYSLNQVLEEENNEDPDIKKLLIQIQARHRFLPMHWKYFKSVVSNMGPLVSYEQTIIVHNLIMSRYIKNQLLYAQFLQFPDDEKLQMYFEDFTLKPPTTEIEEAKKRKMEVDEEVINVPEESKTKKMKVSKNENKIITSSTRVLRSSARKAENIINSRN